ncbi:hypothetical protein [Speluncibacter jeojiensis]|uniref:Uncharacterized protein n=1 Tax=Speluncibacter jeojiensis TaxID=2710754 RepID=A0A9X4LZ25_9ACTN|nr:hypothetical protein [Corynebacteriales bacterium D3-21]
MDELPAERLVRQITERHGRELDAHRSEINEQLADFRAHGRLPSAARRLPNISARSFEAEDIELDLAIGVREVAQFGSINPDNPTLVASVAIGAARTPADGSRRVRVYLSAGEEEAWARAALGPLWADYAYRVFAVRNLVDVYPRFFLVLVDDLGRPTLAPDDFDWVRAGVGGTTAYPQKLAPMNDAALRSRLDRDGDVLPAADVTCGLSSVSRSTWGLQVLSTLADELALATQRSHRTYVEEGCQLDGEALTVRYRWHNRRIDANQHFGIRVPLESFRADLVQRFGSDHPTRAGRLIERVMNEQGGWEDGEIIDGTSWTELPPQT